MTRIEKVIARNKERSAALVAEQASNVRRVGGLVLIPLTRGKTVTISAKDWGLVKHIKWTAFRGTNTWYAKGRNPSAPPMRIFMHRLIINATAGRLCDHVDGNGLNNRRRNLRITTPSGNGINRHRFKAKSGYIGVTFHDDCPLRPWESRIVIGGKCNFLGHYETAELAAAARKSASKKFFIEENSRS